MKLYITFHFKGSDTAEISSIFLRRRLDSKHIMKDFIKLEKTYYELQVDFPDLPVRDSFYEEVCIVEDYRDLHDTFTVKELLSLVKDIQTYENTNKKRK
mgnify:CR=1 FL=1